MSTATETFTRKLFCPLTSEELQARGSELATKMEEREQIEAELAEVKQTFKGRLEGVGNLISELKQIVLERRERREIECFNHMDFENDVVVTLRTDTNQEVDRRRMTAEERQSFLPMMDETLRKLSDNDGKGGKK
jgi:hypothetical protein